VSCGSRAWTRARKSCPGFWSRASARRRSPGARISPRTAEGHRRQVLRKMEVGSTAELATPGSPSSRQLRNPLAGRHVEFTRVVLSA